MMEQANKITENLARDKIKVLPNSEIVAIIAYLQRMGADTEKNKIAENKN
jgi:cytochrome c oxidase cbb3-type subunit I/II